MSRQVLMLDKVLGSQVSCTKGEVFNVSYTKTTSYGYEAAKTFAKSYQESRKSSISFKFGAKFLRLVQTMSIAFQMFFLHKLQQLIRNLVVLKHQLLKIIQRGKPAFIKLIYKACIMFILFKNTRLCMMKIIFHIRFKLEKMIYIWHLILIDSYI